MEKKRESDMTSKKSNKLPHYKVYTRLAPSKIHGVGVFAILQIKKGTYIFHGDDEEMVWINKSKLKNIPKAIKKLYIDFCVKDGNKYGCPNNFNQLTIAWYLNNSKNPNVVCDKDYNFYAKRDIKKGEELTANYSTYSEEISSDRL
jgi:uncharacterized protein